MIKKYCSFFYKIFFILHIIAAISCVFLSILIILVAILPFADPAQFENGINRLHQIMPEITYPLIICALMLCLVKLLFFSLFTRHAKILLINIADYDTPFIPQNKKALKFISICFFFYYVIPVYPLKTLELSYITVGITVSSLLYLFSLIMDEKNI